MDQLKKKRGRGVAPGFGTRSLAFSLECAGSVGEWRRRWLVLLGPEEQEDPLGMEGREGRGRAP